MEREFNKNSSIKDGLSTGPLFKLNMGMLGPDLFYFFRNKFIHSKTPAIRFILVIEME